MTGTWNSKSLELVAKRLLSHPQEECGSRLDESKSCEGSLDNAFFDDIQGVIKNEFLTSYDIVDHLDNFRLFIG